MATTNPFIMGRTAIQKTGYSSMVQHFEEDSKFKQDLLHAKTAANRSAKVCVPMPSLFQVNFMQKDEGCSSLKVNLNEEKPKAVGLLVSGVLNIQCRHTMISTITDLAKGEE
jgi:hypothetical protein